ncbi:MAG TPA: LptA/OstA family protein [Bryobacteraceae bacterium]|nr:LptA/OstA family protein [Bryobacteraceae bacterium]
MRRYSLILAVALVVISAVVGYTLKLRLDKARAQHAHPAPPMKTGLEGVASAGWHWWKNDDQTGRLITDVKAASFEGTHDPSTFELIDARLRMYDKSGSSYTFVQSERALFDEGTGVLRSEGLVHIVMNVPKDKNAEDQAEANKRVRVTTTGVVYETKTGKASTDQPASFVFTEGDGKAVGVAYDPNTKILHLKSQVALDWIGKGPATNKMHIETSDLIYKEAEGKIYMSPWSRMIRQSTRIEAHSTVVTLENHHLHEINGDHAVGSDVRDDRRTGYSADKMVAMFNDKGVLMEIRGDGNARVESGQTGAHTVLTGEHADLHFKLETKQQGKNTVQDSELSLVNADGHSVAISTPLPQPGVKLAETRILRSEHIELAMKPGGKDLQEIRTPSTAQLEFRPNRPDQAHRVVDAAHLRVIYGEGSYVDTLLAWQAVTHTDKAAANVKVKTGPDGKPIPPSPALTWSDLMTVKFAPESNQVATIDQSGNFRYEEGARKAWAKQAYLEQSINRITLSDHARVLDDTGSATGDTIVMNQATGDMDAKGHVLSTHEPDKNQKPGTSMLDAGEPMQARADRMQTRDDNSKVFYEGNVVMWQGANRISADSIAIDRDARGLIAAGNVVSELLDNRTPGATTSDAAAATPDSAANTGPIFTNVYAPKLVYRDDTKVANYSDGVKLTRQKMTITAQDLQAFLTPKSDKPSNESSLNHALATGKVTIHDVISPGRTRVGKGEHCEYYTKEDKVILNGGAPQMTDSFKGITKGMQLTYFSGDDHLIVDGKKAQVAFTKMKKKATPAPQPESSNGMSVSGPQ